jgi:ribosome biogenesis GTPase
MNITDLGFVLGNNQNIETNNNNFNIGRVITVNKESYIISDGEKEYFAKLTGNLLYSSDSPEDYPSVGDFIQFQKFDDDSLTIIHRVLERKNLLKRKSSGKMIDYQIIAANIDYAIIMQALDNDFNINRLERYLTMVKEFKVEPIIVFSKSDLLNEEERNYNIERVKSRTRESQIIYFSNLEKDSLDKIKHLLHSKKTYCLIGSSGVGKTTLINNLIGKNEYATKEVRAGDSKGKHTTTNRNLIVLNNGAMLIDTPGMRELANISVSNGIEQTFDEITKLSYDCKFADCSHTVEKGCAILEAIENGEIESKQYDNFIKLRKESEYHKRSYLENRKRDKEFGKMVKEVMKTKQHKRH